MKNIGLIGIIFFLSAFTLFSQVKIKEKVEIEPASDSSKYLNKNLNRNQLLDEFRCAYSKVFVPKCGDVALEVIYSHAPETSVFDLLILTPEKKTIIYDANHNIGAKWRSGVFSNDTITLVEFGVHFTWNYYGTILSGDVCGDVEDLGDRNYKMYFDAGSEGNDVIIKLRVRAPYDTLIVAGSPPFVLTGDASNITITRRDNYGATIFSSDERRINIALTKNSEDGNLFSPYAGLGNILTNVKEDSLKFVASESLSANSDGEVGISASTADEEEYVVKGTGRIYVESRYGIEVEFIPDTIPVSSEANIHFYKKDWKTGSRESFPPETVFKINLYSEGGYGILYSPEGDTSDYFESITQNGLKFIAANNISSNELVFADVYVSTIDAVKGELFGSGGITIKDFSGIDVKISPDTISPGEEASIILKRIMPDKTTSDFPFDQGFDIQISEGAQYGTILNPNGIDTMDYFIGCSRGENGFKFIAADSIDVDSVSATIVVSTTIGSCIKDW
jgi:hypothetical protein